MHSEYARQREHLERSVASLRKKLSKDSEIHRGDTIRVMQVTFCGSRASDSAAKTFLCVILVPH
jgi:hypothetical protein